jgi:DNA-binding CsgD family transcriptional regulator
VAGELCLVEDSEQRRHGTVDAARLGFEGSSPGVEPAAHRRHHRGDLACRAMSLFARAFGLSARERELVGHLMTGIDTKEVAQRMFLSEHTVQDHLKSIFSKTSVRNRRTLLSRALGT